MDILIYCRGEFGKLAAFNASGVYPDSEGISLAIDMTVRELRQEGVIVRKPVLALIQGGKKD